MNTITVRTTGATVCSHRYDAGLYKPAVHAEFSSPGYYWLAPLAELPGKKWVGLGIRLGECNTRQQLESAIDVATRDCGELEDSIWLLGAITEIDIYANNFDR